jgi:hypothetical protein
VTSTGPENTNPFLFKNTVAFTRSTWVPVPVRLIENGIVDCGSIKLVAPLKVPLTIPSTALGTVNVRGPMLVYIVNVILVLRAKATIYIRNISIFQIQYLEARFPVGYYYCIYLSIVPYKSY